MPSASKSPSRDWRLLWFANLDAALNRSDQPEIQESLRNLARLGIEVRFTLPPCPVVAQQETDDTEVSNARN